MALEQLNSLENKEQRDLSVKLLKPLCSYKKGKETRKFQQKRNIKVKHCINIKSLKDINLNDWLYFRTKLFLKYKHMVEE